MYIDEKAPPSRSTSGKTFQLCVTIIPVALPNFSLALQCCMLPRLPAQWDNLVLVLSLFLLFLPQAI